MRHILNNENGKSRVGTLLVIAFVLYVIAQLFSTPSSHVSTASSSPKPTVNSNLKKGKIWLENYYKKYPIGGGWQNTNISISGADLEVTVVIPDTQANSIMNFEPERQWSIVSAACPNQYEEIWEILDRRQEVIIQGSFSGGIFIDLPCRQLNE